MNIVVLERLQITSGQKARLSKLGDVCWFDTSTENECQKRVIGADVVIVDWIDPSPFILEMKSPSLVALMSTGFDWIKHRNEARNRGTLISNVPGYASEAVAEHIIGLSLAVARHIVTGAQMVRSGEKAKGHLQGIELFGRTIGIIGLGRIGSRVADLARAFGMKIITYNRNPKNNPDIQDVKLAELLQSSDIVCVTCPLNDESRGMLSAKNIGLMRKGSILVGATWDIVNIPELIPLLQSGHIRGFGFDAAIEGGGIDLPVDLRQLDNVVITPHVGFNTSEAVIRQIDICIENIIAFIKNRPINIVN